MAQCLFREMAKMHFIIVISQTCTFHIMEDLWHTRDFICLYWIRTYLRLIDQLLHTSITHSRRMKLFHLMLCCKMLKIDLLTVCIYIYLLVNMYGSNMVKFSAFRYSSLLNSFIFKIGLWITKFANLFRWFYQWNLFLSSCCANGDQF